MYRSPSNNLETLQGHLRGGYAPLAAMVDQMRNTYGPGWGQAGCARTWSLLVLAGSAAVRQVSPTTHLQAPWAGGTGPDASTSAAGSPSP
jgi:hypothetical protein